MTELLTAAQMRAIEQAAIESGAVTGLELMERAGQGVVDAIFAQWPKFATTRGPAPAPPEFNLPDEMETRRAVVLCGPGNNGGDGFVVARLLREAGWAVEVFLYGDAEKLPPDARVNYERWSDIGEVTSAMPQGACDLVIDALFGTGLTRPLADDLVTSVESLLDGALMDDPNSKTKIVAVDILSGLCADSGKCLGQTAPYFAHLTVSFHRMKLGHILDHASERSWSMHIVDLELAETADAVCLIPGQGNRFSKRLGHKYSHGHALILSGGVGKGGAARMAARGALRIGAGAVTVGCPPAALIENAAQVNAVMLRRVKDADGLAAVLEDKRINALCLGPGLGTGAREAALVATALQAGRRLLLDADALTLLSRDTDLFGQLHSDCVLTPHAGEFARLFPEIAEKLDAPSTTGPAYSKVDATRDAARRAGCVVLFKGPDTVIADPDGRCSVNAAVYDRAAPWLATAGAGDVLAGFITGLLARGFAPMQAAEAGAWLHVECARAFGPGLIAEDLPEALPGVLKALGA
ncbi:NAD(P)H-hydrate dehydratase [Loktanella sp. DJP18]|uniref:NAD(P)H-hydrate dehydratase n=1 Tax=Loktanella sp. DJP18 TaxID=3409788 RepID=UPI003BB612DC